MTTLKTIPMLALIAAFSVAGLAVGREGAFARDREHNDREHQQNNKADNKNKQAAKKKKKGPDYQCVREPCGDRANTTNSQSSPATTTTKNQGGGVTKTVPTATGDTGNMITISNGRTKVTIPAGPGGLTVSSNKKDGTITVFNGFETRTLRGGSLVVSGVGVKSGAVYTQTTSDTESKRNSQGEMVFAIKP